MQFEVRGSGGLYPDGCAFRTDTANGAIERYRAISIACGRANVFDGHGRRLSSKALMALARAELTVE